MKKLFNFITLFFLLLSAGVYSQLEGKVVKVKDGDTIVILDENNKQHTIRVADIDCPEKNQPFGKKAKWFVSDQIYLKTVKIDVKSKDRYGRTIGLVLYQNKNLSGELLKVGLAWHYKKYSNNNYFSRLEKTAKQNKKGLWIDKNAVAPWNWRKYKKRKRYN